MKRKPLKIIAIVLAVVIVGVAGFFANAFFGNPVSKTLAELTAEKHLSEVYADTDFEIENVIYDFKVSAYYVNIISPSSKDSYFDIACDFFGRLVYDSYESRVLSGENTARRLENEYYDAVREVLQGDDFPYECEIGFGDVNFNTEDFEASADTPDYAIIFETLELDKSYDMKEIGTQAGHLYVYLNVEEITEEQMAKVLLDLKNAMDKAGVTFCSVDCQLENNDAETWLEVRNFLYSDIYEEDLIERVKKSVKETKEYYEAMDKEAEVVLDEK